MLRAEIMQVLVLSEQESMRFEVLSPVPAENPSVSWANAGVSCWRAASEGSFGMHVRKADGVRATHKASKSESLLRSHSNPEGTGSSWPKVLWPWPSTSAAEPKDDFLSAITSNAESLFPRARASETISLWKLDGPAPVTY